ncbi:TrmB family transcriptional regulator [Propylenella binzhouense]|uniref:TrmB family transcriptional regulator n=1 Tax=Propylenella binzhouense TaxID=2555902 RepID=A0A964T9B0_9HYPH|nr:TrmB family transcriptional regulator [Propylenella binzhouense]MYZ50159.1 TrmB family transcriptional regulator [Propylenella binzhouense]
MVGKLAVEELPSADIFADLRRLGFTEYEARVYVQLLRESPATAYEIAKAAGIPRPNTYHALDALARRGAVLPVSENPVRYVAAEPRTLLEAIARQTDALCSDLAGKLAALKPRAEDQYVWTMRGEAIVHDRIGALIAESREAIWVKAADEVLRRHKGALRAAAERGVELLIVLFGQDADEFRFTDACRIYLHEATGVRMGTADNLFTLAVDHVEMLTAAMDEEVVAAHTRNRPIVNMAESLIRHDYYMAEIFARFGRDIESAFGPHLRDIRMACFSPGQIASFKERTGLA